MRNGIVVAALVSLAFGVASAQETEMYRGDVKTMLGIARGFGVAELKTSDKGVPYIELIVRGQYRYIWFNECNDSKTTCKLIKTNVIVKGSGDLEKLNELNYYSIYGRMTRMKDGSVLYANQINVGDGVSYATMVSYMKNSDSDISFIEGSLK